MSLEGLVGSFAVLAAALPALNPRDVEFQRPKPPSFYVPDRTDERFAGKGFAVICRVGAAGRLTGCRAEGAPSRAIERWALTYVSTWSVAAKTRSGERTGNRLIRIPIRLRDG